MTKELIYPVRRAAQQAIDGLTQNAGAAKAGKVGKVDGKKPKQAKPRNAKRRPLPQVPIRFPRIVR